MDGKPDVEDGNRMPESRRVFRSSDGNTPGSNKLVDFLILSLQPFNGTAALTALSNPTIKRQHHAK